MKDAPILRMTPRQLEQLARRNRSATKRDTARRAREEPEVSVEAQRMFRDMQRRPFQE